MTDVLAEYAASFGDRDRAGLTAAGVWADNPAAPGVFAVVFQGKLTELVIPDSYLKLRPQELADVINAVIANAVVDIRDARRRLAAPEVRD